MNPPVVLLVPSRAAALELPRRLASSGRAVTGLYPMTLADVVRAIAEPALLGSGLAPWDGGHGALLAARLLDTPHGLLIDPRLPRPPIATALARTLTLLRREGVPPEIVESATRSAGGDPDDAARVRAVGLLYRQFHDAIEGRFADPTALARAARAHAESAGWLRGAEVLVVGELDASAEERALLGRLARLLPVRRLPFAAPAALRRSTFAAWAEAHGIPEADWEATRLAPLRPPAPATGLARLRSGLFEAPPGDEATGDDVTLLTAAGEAAEARAVARRLLRAAERGVPFEDMGVLLARPAEYAALFADLFDRLGVPFRLHPSLPLTTGRAARSLLLLFRCRGLERAAVMEFLTFAPIPFEDLLGAGARPSPARWDQISRDAGIVSGLDRWMIGLRGFAEQKRDEALRLTGTDAEARRARAMRQAEDAEALLRVVELVSATLDGLSGSAPWAEWAERLRGTLDQWVAEGVRDRAAVLDVVADLGALAFLGKDAPWADVEQVLVSRFEWERVPLDPVEGGAVHVGALDALAGLPFRVVAIPGLVEGGYPGVVRPDPFLLDPEREAISRAARAREAETASPPGRKGAAPQLSLLDVMEDVTPTAASRDPYAESPRLPTQQDRVTDLRREFHRAVSQATERLILSYPRADARTGRERLPSLFFVAAATALAGRPLSAAELEARLEEDAADALALEEALDPGERDRLRVRRGGAEAEKAVAAGSHFFRQSRQAYQSRWRSRALTTYEGLAHPLSAAAAARLDPTRSPFPVSASRLAVFARCGFQYFVENVLRAEAAVEPEERMGLDPLERGNAFHTAAERYLRECRDAGRLPVRDMPDERRRLLEIADETLKEVVAHAPPRFTVLWDRTRERFRADLLNWLGREAKGAHRATPAHFEVQFGVPRAAGTAEPHLTEPVTVDLGDGRTLRISGKIDRIDRRADGLVLRDYKTGRRYDEGVFSGGRQLQIPFYVLAASRIFPGERVVDAFLDYVDGGGQVAFPLDKVGTPEFTALLRAMVDAIGNGLFVQEPTACPRCDYTAVCGPAPLLETRRRFKLNDRRLQQVLRIRDFA